MRQTTKGHVRKRENGAWEGQYTYQGTKYSIYHRSEQVTRTYLKGILDSIRDGTYVRPNDYTVEAWMLEWYKTYATSSLRPTTFTSYESIIRKHIIPAIGKIYLNNISTRTLQNFFNDKTIGGRHDGKEGGLSPKTLRNIKYILNVAFDKAYFSRMIEYNPLLCYKGA